MDRWSGGGEDVAGAPDRDDQALEFVRFCHRRRPVGWPELYDEMCGVAGRRLYRGFGPEELGEIGIRFGLFEMPTLAAVVARVVAEESERRRRLGDDAAARVVVAGRSRRMAHPASEDTAAVAIATDSPAREPEATDRSAPDMPRVRLALATGA